MFYPALCLLLLSAGSWSKPSGLSKEAIEAFVSDNQMSEKELLLLKTRLRRLAASREFHAQRNPYEERVAIAFSYDHFDEEVTPNLNTEEAINQRAGLSDYLFQGDILLTPQQAFRKLQIRTKRAALPPDDASFAKWNPERIPYVFDGSVPWHRRDDIEEVLNYYRERTCLRFANSWPSRSEIALRFRMSAGCWSYVGRLPRYQVFYGLQDIGFEHGCFNQFGTIAHEIMHALGFQHEHIRKDRDNYVVVNFQNIWKNDSYNYDKDLRGDYQGFEYELGSQMHYGEVGDAYNLGTAKLYTRDYKQILTIGNRMFPSFQDIAQINKYYNCYDRCKNVTINCQNGGRPKVNNCSFCECPHGFAGQFCTDLEPSTVQTPNCGGILEAVVGKVQTYTGKLKSEIWQKFLVEKCFWHIKAPEGRKVKVFVTAQDLHCAAGCPWSAMEVKTGKFDITGTRKCCTAGTSYDYYTSESNLLVIGLYNKLGEVNATWSYSAA